MIDSLFAHIDCRTLAPIEDMKLYACFIAQLAAQTIQSVNFPDQSPFPDSSKAVSRFDQLLPPGSGSFDLTLGYKTSRRSCLAVE